MNLLERYFERLKRMNETVKKIESVSSISSVPNTRPQVKEVLAPSELVIIAGPNGAGKSTTSDDLLFDLNIKSFDFDKEFYSSWAKYDYDPMVENGVKESVGELFEQRKRGAIASGAPFSFETNYHSDEILKTLTEFKAAGFFTELIFIILETPEMAIGRVVDRASKGGHFVDEETIRRRFFDGLELLNSTFLQYNAISIYVSLPYQIESALLIEVGSNKAELLGNIPEQVDIHLPKLKLFKES